jgi:hypothetical protein
MAADLMIERARAGDGEAFRKPVPTRIAADLLSSRALSATRWGHA